MPVEVEMIGQSKLFLDALAHASALATLNRPVLILGERGSGKELIANRLHFLSKRWGGPFLTVNCAALSDDLLDSELFGHEAGAFTGAQKRHRGRFERADGGTLFLDEIPSASLRVQEKLLRVIEYGTFERIGGEATIESDVRVIAAANTDLRAAARAGRFRADLLDRLAFDVVVAPPLRARPDDIPLLAAHFAARMAREIDQPFEGFGEDVMRTFLAHGWPGNVRELKNAAERSWFRWVSSGGAGPVGAAEIEPLAAFDDGGARPVAPEVKVAAAAPPDDLRAALDSLERRWASEALRLTGGNQRRAASRLGLTYDQLRGVLRKHALAGAAAGGAQGEAGRAAGSSRNHPVTE